jgi:N-acetylglucosaminyldiphosphoundecaprenol N-acetyl-beta-D-mannosaminyltransferase
MNDIGKIEICGLKIDNAGNSDLEKRIIDSIAQNKKLLITYANANTINKIYNDKQLAVKLNSFDIIHPDGAGIYMASKILYGANGFKTRMTGSDFYPVVAEAAIKNRWKIFFFGHSENTLNKINDNCPDLNIAGLQKGYDFNDDEVISSINTAQPEIVIIGLSFPKQEEWILNNIGKLNCKVYLCAGDGIKVFSGTKFRGPKIMRTLGFEWFFRFLANPVKYFNRYLLGNPLFLYRIITLKFRKFKE